MKKYLITGSTGFLGSILMKEFNKNDIQADTLNSFCGDRNEKVDLRVSFTFIENMLFDTVIHSAGKAHSVPKSQEEEIEFYDINFQGTKNLCQAIDELPKKPNSFIFISTVAVYGLDQGEDIVENYPLKGSTPYAKSKILAEEFLIEWAKKNQITLGVLRLPLIAGVNPPGNLGAMINGIRSGKYLSIGSANAHKSIVWAKDIADVIQVLANKGGIYNLTDGQHPSFGELEKEISIALGKSNPFKIPLFVAKIMAAVGNLLGSKSPINSDKLRKITSTLTFDDSKARIELGWNPTKVLDKIHEIV